MSLFGPQRDEKRIAALRNLKELVRELFSASEDDAVIVNELACTEPGCPPVETIIALLQAGHKPRQLKVHKPIVEVTEADIRTAFAGVHDHDAGE